MARRSGSSSRAETVRTQSSWVVARKPVTPSSIASQNGPVGVATVGVSTSAASSHLMALLASLNRLSPTSGARFTSRFRNAPGSSNQCWKGMRRTRLPNRRSSGESGR